MAWISFLVVVVVQAIIAGIVIFVLKRLLDRELIEGAMEKLQASSIPVGQDVIVYSIGPLKEETIARITALIKRKSQDIKISFQYDPQIKGGVMIQWGNEKIDFSLSNRLSEMKR